MNKKYVALNHFIIFVIPFIALLMSFYVFRITNWITPLGEIESTSVKWAFDLTFNTSVLNVVYELIKLKINPSFNYTIKIQNLRDDNNLTLTEKEAEEATKIKCKIIIQKNKDKKKTSDRIKINYPKWLTVTADNIDDIDEEAIVNNEDSDQITINPNYLFNFETKEDETYMLYLKIMPRVISHKKGSIEGTIEGLCWKPLRINDSIEPFKIVVL